MTVGQIRPLIGLKDSDHLLDLISKNNLSSRQVENLVKQKNKKEPLSKSKDLDILELEKDILEIKIKMNLLVVDGSSLYIITIFFVLG